MTFDKPDVRRSGSGPEFPFAVLDLACQPRDLGIK
jgi:hypothetical protein